MKADQNLAADEAQRITQHESVKGEVRQKVHSEIARQVDRVDAAEADHAEALADSLKRKAVSEVRNTEAELDRSRAFARGSQFVDYVFYVIYGVIALAILLELMGARNSAGFKQFIDAITFPLLLPFRGLVSDPAVGSGGSQVMFSYVVALGVYILLHLAITGLLRLFVQRKTAV
jgi:uncharacterized protein YggT (Ycf19 family)